MEDKQMVVCDEFSEESKNFHMDSEHWRFTEGSHNEGAPPQFAKVSQKMMFHFFRDTRRMGYRILEIDFRQTNSGETIK